MLLWEESLVREARLLSCLVNISSPLPLHSGCWFDEMRGCQTKQVCDGFGPVPNMFAANENQVSAPSNKNQGTFSDKGHVTSKVLIQSFFSLSSQVYFLCVCLHIPIWMCDGEESCGTPSLGALTWYHASLDSQLCIISDLDVVSASLSYVRAIHRQCQDKSLQRHRSAKGLLAFSQHHKSFS